MTVKNIANVGCQSSGASSSDIDNIKQDVLNLQNGTEAIRLAFGAKA